MNSNPVVQTLWPLSSGTWCDSVSPVVLV
jgi:hypothetical protein